MLQVVQRHIFLQYPEKNGLYDVLCFIVVFHDRKSITVQRRIMRHKKGLYVCRAVHLRAKVIKFYKKEKPRKQITGLFFFMGIFFCGNSSYFFTRLILQPTDLVSSGLIFLPATILSMAFLRNMTLAAAGSAGLSSIAPL